MSFNHEKVFVWNASIWVCGPCTYLIACVCLLSTLLREQSELYKKPGTSGALENDKYIDKLIRMGFLWKKVSFRVLRSDTYGLYCTYAVLYRILSILDLDFRNINLHFRKLLIKQNECKCNRMSTQCLNLLFQTKQQGAKGGFFSESAMCYLSNLLK